MSIHCPYCHHTVAIKRAKPGPHTPKCPKCARAFVLVVPDNPDLAMIVGPLPTEAPAEKAPPAEEPSITGVFQPPAARDADVPGENLTPTAPPRASSAGEGPHGSTRQAVGRTVTGTKKGGTGEAIPDKIGGYQILKELGRGGMGTVFLGRQISLDRPVALKVMDAKLASDPAFVARFTREAYAAAQLVHHNVVQIYDIGAEQDLHFFSMEFIHGQSLAELVRKQTKLDPEVAVGYVLQAARGLKFGHDLSMIHRDVKPDNLMLNDQGIVKVADLGLVKLPHRLGESNEPRETAKPPPGAQTFQASPRSSLADPGEVTQVGVAMGTPAYMAPEQAKDAAHVDGRADIYSLGCTLYVLLTGRTPFQGKTALELITRHASDPVVPPEEIARRVPKALSAILLKMMAKKPEDRYASMDEIILVLENYLGIRTSGPFTPQEEHAAVLEECVMKFNAAPAARLRSWVALGFFGGCALWFLALLLFGKFLLAGGVLGLSMLAPLCYFLIHGFQRKPYLFLKFREWVLGSRLIDWLTWFTGATFFILVLYLIGWLWVWLGFCLIALALALGFHLLLDRQVARQRQQPIQEVESLLRRMRLLGLEEGTVRQFVTKYSGQRWEEFYEALFGYEAKLQARDWIRGETGKDREKFASWREPVIQWIESRQRARREAQQRKVLQAAEEKALKAEGLKAAEARMKAEARAKAMVQQATEIQQEEGPGPPGSPMAARTPEEKRARIKAMLAAARGPNALEGRRLTPERVLTGVMNSLANPRLRTLVGVTLMAGCVAWMLQNEMISSKKLTESAQEAREVLEKGNINDANVEAPLGKASAAFDLSVEKTDALRVVGVPSRLTNLFDSFNPGVAGLMLALSAMFRGWKVNLVIWPSALVVFLGPHQGIPALGSWTAAQSSLVVGIAMAVVGLYLFGGRK